MFDLQQYLDHRRTTVETALDGMLPPADEPPAVLHEAMRYAVFSGGKRIRPILCMAAAEACGGTAQDGCTPGCAVEVLHTYTLVHDDLPCMDDDTERRGKPTVHVAYGETEAVLAGDALQALAFELVAHTAPTAQWSTAAMVHELAAAAGSRGVVGGQVVDLALANQPPTEAQMSFIHQHKTADLFCAAIRLGAMAANGSPARIDALGRYATHLGLAFQITDDLLDTPADGSAPVEASYLNLATPAEARAQVQRLIDDAVSALSICDNRGAEALRAVARYIPERSH